MPSAVASDFATGRVGCASPAFVSADLTLVEANGSSQIDLGKAERRSALAHDLGHLHSSHCPSKVPLRQI